MWGVLPLAFDYIIGWGPFAFNIGYFKGAVSQNLSISKLWEMQGAKKTIFTACHSGKLKLAFTSPDVIQLAPKTFWLAELISQFFCYSNSSKNISYPLGKLKTEFTCPIAKSTSPGLSDTTFFARWGDATKFSKTNWLVIGLIEYFDCIVFRSWLQWFIQFTVWWDLIPCHQLVVKRWVLRNKSRGYLW